MKKHLLAILLAALGIFTAIALIAQTGGTPPGLSQIALYYRASITSPYWYKWVNLDPSLKMDTTSGSTPQLAVDWSHAPAADFSAIKSQLDAVNAQVAALEGQLAALSSGPVSGSFQSIITDLKPSLSNPKVLQIAAGRCWGAQKPAATVTITAGNGNGSGEVYCTDTQTIVIEHAAAAGLTVSCTNCAASQVTTPETPHGMYRIASFTLSSGQFASVVDQRDFTTRLRLQNGTGMDVQCAGVAGSSCIVQVDPVTAQLRTDPYTPVSGLDASGASTTKPIKTGTSVPATCTAGEFFYKADAAAGQRIYECDNGAFVALSAQPVAPPDAAALLPR